MYCTSWISARCWSQSKQIFIVQSLCNSSWPWHHILPLCVFFLFSTLVGLPGLISLLPLTSPMGSFHQRASCLNTRAHKTLWATPQHITLYPPHPELWPQARSRAQAPERSRTSCSRSLVELRDWACRTEGAGCRATWDQDSPQQKPAEENQQELEETAH